MIDFTASPNSADILILFSNDPLTLAGSPVFTTNLYDGATLLGSCTARPFSYNGQSSFVAAFVAPGEGSGVALYNPVNVPFASMNSGTITGRLVTTVSGGSVSGFNTSDLILYDGISAGANSFRPLNDVTITSLKLTSTPQPAPAIAFRGITNAAGAADGLAPVAPGSLVSIYGSNLSATGGGSAASFPLPATLYGSQVLMNGVPSPLLYVSPSLINAQIPWE